MNKYSDDNSNEMTKNDVVTTEAASWLAQIDSGSFSPADKLALAEWMSRSPRHVREIRRLEQLWSGIDSLLDEALLPQTQVSLSNVLTAWVRLHPLQFSTALTALACTIVLFFSILSTNTIQPPIAKNDHTFTYQAQRGARRLVVLSDGSTMHLNSSSIAQVTYQDNERQVRLLSGEAIFDVAKNSKRPFRVYAGHGRVEAIGTSFLVKLSKDDLELMVTEGRVRIDTLSFQEISNTDTTRQSSKTHQEVYVDQGHRVTLSNLGNVMAVDADTIARHTAWVNGKHIFQGDSLQYIVDEISRYSAKRIVITDPDLRKLRMGGIFNIGEVDTFLAVLEASLQVSVERVEDDLVYIKRRQH